MTKTARDVIAEIQIDNDPLALAGGPVSKTLANGYHNADRAIAALAAAGFVIVPKDDLNSVRQFRNCVDAFLTTMSNPGAKIDIDNTPGSNYHEMVLAHYKVDELIDRNSRPFDASGA